MPVMYSIWELFILYQQVYPVSACSMFTMIFWGGGSSGFLSSWFSFSFLSCCVVLTFFRRWIWAAVSVSDAVAQDTGWRTAPTRGVAVGGAEVEGKVRTSRVGSSPPPEHSSTGYSCIQCWFVFILQICSVTGVESRDTSPATVNRRRTVRWRR